MQATVCGDLLIECHANFEIRGQCLCREVAASDSAGGGPARVVVGAALPAGQQSGGSKGDFLSEAFVIHGEAAVMRRPW
jgi:hypothetical protein